MSEAGIAVVVLFVALFVTVGGGLFLYVLVAAERDDRAVMDREAAERVARRDTDDRTVQRDTDDRTARRGTDNDRTAGWNTDDERDRR